ncbi:helix-turn-helix transcriptional regulator [Bellilinea sp.]|uniref:helix-turn-helix domain-containing protein n=1 Tax=Bellilinea sp. TaxID=2838785 RepID=UPI002ADE3D29|nr:helix-turn-helix transcriptional regulator [Bellilinea sp.]
MDFSDWLLNEINKRGWSQAELARRAGIPRQIISNYINRQREKPDSDVLVSISRALNLPPETVFRAAGLLPPVSPDTEYQEQFTTFRNFPPMSVRKY